MDIDLLFSKSNLIPAIIQEEKNGEVLMLAYMDKKSLGMTMESGYTWFYSRSRSEYWNKGKTSGNVQKVKKILTDCDTDTLLVFVEQTGGACHTGAHNCFFNNVWSDDNE